jgi:hypothetical protein
VLNKWLGNDLGDLAFWLCHRHYVQQNPAWDHGKHMMLRKNRYKLAERRRAPDCQLQLRGRCAAQPIGTSGSASASEESS